MDIKELARRYARDQKAGRQTKVRYVGENRDGLIQGKVYSVIDIVFYDKVEVAIMKKWKVVSSAFIEADEMEDPVTKKLDIATGRIYEYDGSTRRYAWSQRMLDDMRRFFPTTSNADMAHIVGVSERVMVRKARELGLEKDPQYIKKIWARNAQVAHLQSKKMGYPGGFQKGHAPTASCFQKGKISLNRKPVVRLDTGEQYESIKAISDALGVAPQTTREACKRGGRVKGVAVRFAVL